MLSFQEAGAFTAPPDSDWAYSWSYASGDKPLVGDFNGDGRDDIAVFRTSGQAAEWFVSVSVSINDSTGAFQVSNPAWQYVWGNKTGDGPLVGNFDGTKFQDIMIHRTSGYANWFASLSSGTQFVSTNPYWELSYGNLTGDKPVIADFNGDGVDDIGILRGGASPSWIVNRIKPGEVRSPATGTIPKQVGVDGSIPIVFDLQQNYPNPFNPVTMIRYSIPSKSQVRLQILDILGRRVKTLVDEVKDSGHYNVQFDGARMSSGLYFYKLTSDKNLKVKKMLLIR